MHLQPLAAGEDVFLLHLCAAVDQGQMTEIMRIPTEVGRHKGRAQKQSEKRQDKAYIGSLLRVVYPVTEFTRAPADHVIIIEHLSSQLITKPGGCH